MADISEELIERLRAIRWREGVTGSVIEFAFGPEPNAYFCTSYPYPTTEGNRHDKRIYYSQHLPTRLEEFLASDEWRFIQNVAISPEGEYLLYYTPQGMRPDNEASFEWDRDEMDRQMWTRYVRILTENNRGDISSLAFSQNPKKFFMRLTLRKDNTWKMMFGPGTDPECQELLLAKAKLRACTFGCDDAWLIYGKDWHRWGKGLLPPDLESYLEEGKKNHWQINKAVLNPYKPDEYVLVYDNGRAFGSFDQSFHGKFNEVFDQWRKAKLATNRDDVKFLGDAVLRVPGSLATQEKSSPPKRHPSQGESDHTSISGHRPSRSGDKHQRGPSAVVEDATGSASESYDKKSNRSGISAHDLTPDSLSEEPYQWKTRDELPQPRPNDSREKEHWWNKRPNKRSGLVSVDELGMERPDPLESGNIDRRQDTTAPEPPLGDVLANASGEAVTAGITNSSKAGSNPPTRTSSRAPTSVFSHSTGATSRTDIDTRSSDRMGQPYSARKASTPRNPPKSSQYLAGNSRAAKVMTSSRTSTSVRVSTIRARSPGANTVSLEHSQESSGVEISSNKADTESGEADLVAATIDRLAAVLFKDITLQDLCLVAVLPNRCGERFQEAFRNILLRFAAELKFEDRLEQPKKLYDLIEEQVESLAESFCNKLYTKLRYDIDHQKIIQEIRNNRSVAEDKANPYTFDNDKDPNDYSEQSTLERTKSKTGEADGWNMYLRDTRVLNFITEDEATLSNFTFSFFYSHLVTLTQPFLTGLNLLFNLFPFVSPKEQVKGQEIQQVVAKLRDAQPHSIELTGNYEPSLQDIAQRFVEDVTGGPWHWWPLEPPQPSILAGHTRLHWRCNCNEQCWVDLRSEDAGKIFKLARECSRPNRAPKPASASNMQSQLSHSKNAQGPAQGIISTLKQIITAASGKRSSASPNSSAGSLSAADTSASGSSAANAQGAASSTSTSPQNFSQLSPRRYPAQDLRGRWGATSDPSALFVFLVVSAGTLYRFAQLKIAPFSAPDDIPSEQSSGFKSRERNKNPPVLNPVRSTHEFFEQLQFWYLRLRGWRRYLSVWRYSHCDFYKIHKFRNHEFGTVDRGFPESKHYEYVFNPRPMDELPPITQQEFTSRFYQTYSPHLFLPLWYPYHRPCNNREKLNFLPKRIREVEVQGDEIDRFWGLYARERLCYLVVAFYTLLCMTPSIVFFFQWVYKWDHPYDLSNASTPLTLTIMTLSFFWGYLYTVGESRK